MAIKKSTGYACSYCGKLFVDPAKADSCRDSHNLVYVQLSADDLGRLVQFIFIKEDDLLTDTLVNSLLRYTRRAGLE